MQVQSVLFHPTEAYLLASASFDKSVCLVDCRNGSSSLKVPIMSDPESLAWDPHNSNHLYSSLEDGSVICIDIRQATASPLFSFQAHDQTTSSISFSPNVPGLMATSSIDQTVKIWDVKDVPSSSSRLPKLVGYKTMNVGKVFAMQFSIDVPYLLGCGGDGGLVGIWESDELDAVQRHFSSRQSIDSSSLPSYIDLLAIDRGHDAAVATGDEVIMDAAGEVGASGEEVEAMKKDKKKKKKHNK